METPTFEQIDAAFSGFDSSKHEAELERLGATASPAAILGGLCPIYKVVRPFLVAAAGLPFIPPAWKTGIKALISALDLLCPQAKS
jgi:hypothetical protein